MTPEHAHPPGSPLDDDLGRLLADGLRHDVERPVDGGRLVTGARRGAARIRRRRRAATVVAAVVVLGVPAGAVTSRFLGGTSGETSTASSASRAGQADTAARAAAPSASASSLLGAATPREGGGSAAAGATAASAPPPPTGLSASKNFSATSRITGTTAALPRTPSGAVRIPAAALLVATDLRPVTAVALARVSDTADSGTAPAVTAGDVCGEGVVAGPPAAGARAVTFRPAQGTAPDWLLASTVRVYAGAGAQRYVAALVAQPCLQASSGGGLGAGAVGHGAADAQGRTHWFGVGLAGRTVTEVRLVVPQGSAVTVDQVAALLATAGQRLIASGLPAGASADPSLS